MTDELLSQEEIEALLKGIGGGTTKEKEREELARLHRCMLGLSQTFCNCFREKR